MERMYTGFEGTRKILNSIYIASAYGERDLEKSCLMCYAGEQVAVGARRCLELMQLLTLLLEEAIRPLSFQSIFMIGVNQSFKQELE